MASGIWPSVSGAVAQSDAVDSVANNLANMNTMGYKKDQPTFKEYLSNLERVKDPPDIPRSPFKDKDFYPLDGRDQAFVVMDSTYTNFTQGPLRVTHNPMDLALQGPGFFEVSTPSGVHYTRHGGFKIATDGKLVTTEGFPVLASQPGGLASALPSQGNVQPGQGGQLTQGGVAAGQADRAPAEIPPEIQARYITIEKPGPNISVTKQGQIYDGDNQIASLSIVEFQDPKKLRKFQGQKFLNPDPANFKNPLEPKGTAVHQGMLEASNVNPVEEMTKMIKAQRLFESNLKSVKTYDQMMQKIANEVGGY